MSPDIGIAVSKNKTGKMSCLFNDLWQGLVSLFFPSFCIVCDTRIEESGSLVCTECWNNLKILPSEILNEKPVPEHLESIFAVFLFDDAIQEIIHGLKYKGYRSAGIKLGRILARFIPENYLNENDILVPIPLHPVKKRERGYNQSAFIAKGISQVTGNPVQENMLIRLKNTVTQTHLDARERHENMKNAFGLSRRFKFDDTSSVVLIDDVFTTGATMDAAAKVLNDNGISSVKGLTVAAPI